MKVQVKLCSKLRAFVTCFSPCVLCACQQKAVSNRCFLLFSSMPTAEQKAEADQGPGRQYGD